MKNMLLNRTFQKCFWLSHWSEDEEKKKVVEKIPRLAVNLQISTTNFYEINVTSTQHQHPPPPTHNNNQRKENKKKGLIGWVTRKDPQFFSFIKWKIQQHLLSLSLNLAITDSSKLLGSFLFQRRKSFYPPNTKKKKKCMMLEYKAIIIHLVSNSANSIWIPTIFNVPASS